MPIYSEEGPKVEPGATPKLFGMGLRDTLLILGAALALGLMLFLWVYLTRKQRPSHNSHGSLILVKRDKHRSRESSPSTRRRRRRRRPDHPDGLPRNPTLQETGGLPPPRPDEPAEPTQ
jgi:hypothetical protein